MRTELQYLRDSYVFRRLVEQPCRIVLSGGTLVSPSAEPGLVAERLSVNVPSREQQCAAIRIMAWCSHQRQEPKQAF